MRHSTTYSDPSSTTDSGPDPFGDAAADDLTREFWGDGAGWVARTPETDTGRAARAFQIRSDQATNSFRLDDTPTSLQAIRDGIAAFRPARRRRSDTTAPIERTREHGVVRHGSPSPVEREPAAARRGRPSLAELPHREASIAELAAGTFEPVAPSGDRGTDLEPTLMIPIGGNTAAGRLGLDGVNPAHVRIGIVILALLLAIPLALALRSANERSVRTDTTVLATVPAAAGAPPEVLADGESGDAAASSGSTAAAEPPAAPADGDATTSSPASAPTSATESASAAAPAPAADEASVGEAHLTESAPEAIVDDANSSVDAGATVDETAERQVPDCSLTYTAAVGDSWYRIASAAGVTPSAVLAQNTATVDTVMLPGDTICLPAGATVPAPPTTVAPTTTAAPTTTVAPTTTIAPTTTAAPTTTVAPIPTTSREQVQALIREIWPDELEEKALDIAYRESRYEATADNGWCCVGVFQIYWTVHQSWLDDYGITTRDQLKDARKNITAAYALYQRAGGWGPWGG